LNSEHVLRMDGVSKKFRKGELFDSLRDALPALAGKLVRRRNRGAPSKQEFWALKEITFSVGKGEALGIIGHNGAGKSTILKLLSGLMKPTTGTMHVNGSLSALIEVGAGFHPDLTGRENIYLNGAILGLSRGAIAQKFDHIVEFSGLAEFVDTPVKRYSTGMYARLGFSVAAHVDSDILLVDEVLSVGDYLFRKRCMDRMREIVGRGSAIVFVSHDFDAISKFCTNAILLDRGSIVARGPTQDVIAAYFEAGRLQQGDSRQKDVYISGFGIRGTDGPRSNFKAGEDAWLDIEVTANRRMEQMVLTAYLRDARNIDIFYASMLRLGLTEFTLDAGETKTLTVHLKLHLAGGAFLIGVDVYTCDNTISARGASSSDPSPFRIHDDRFPVGTLLIDSPSDVGGIANLYPEITMGHSTHLSKLPECLGDSTLEAAVKSVLRGRPGLVMGSAGEMPANGDGLLSEQVSNR
jgi:lipopolysaccharide transport system ATP-binding protein